MSIDMNLLSVNADALSTNQNDELSGWNVPSRMAFHIVFDGRLDINGKLSPVIRRPYRDTSRPYNQRRDFMAHESRQILDDRMPDGVEYGRVRRMGGGADERLQDMGDLGIKSVDDDLGDGANGSRRGIALDPSRIFCPALL